MLRTIIYFFGVILILIAPGCKKEPGPTTIKGRVVDIETGEPLADAVVYFFYRERPNDENSNKEVDIKTNSNGEFVCTFQDLSEWPKIQKEGYLGKDLGNFFGYANTPNKNYTYEVTIGTTLDIGDQGLYRNDGVFKVILSNEVGNANSITGVLESRIMRKEVVTSLFFSYTEKVITDIPEGQERELIYHIPSDDWVTVYWGDMFFGSTQFAPHIDSFYVGKTDTAVYKINF